MIEDPAGESNPLEELQKDISAQFSEIQAQLVDLRQGGGVQGLTSMSMRNASAGRVRYTDESSGGGVWFKVTDAGSGYVDISDGYGLAGITLTQVTWAGTSQYNFSGEIDGTYVLRLKHELSTGVWTVDSVAYTSPVYPAEGDFDVGDDDTSVWPLALVTVGSALVTNIVQMHPTEQAVVNETRL